MCGSDGVGRNICSREGVMVWEGISVAGRV